MNHAFLAGYLDGLGVGGVEAALAPTEGECCVRLRSAAPGGPAAGPGLAREPGGS
jgi:hypothetical protein